MAPTIEGTSTQYIDITPTWRGAMSVYIAILMGDSDPEAKKTAAGDPPSRRRSRRAPA